jgi:hypothetical protein
MKVISEIPKDKVLVSLTKKELANLLGEYSEYDIKREVLDNMILQEIDFPISDIYIKHYKINQLQKQASHDKARFKLEEMLEALTPIENLISALTDKENQNEEENKTMSCLWK